MRTHIHTDTHTYTHIHTHTYTHTHTHTYTHIHIHTYIHTQIHTNTYIHIMQTVEGEGQYHSTETIREYAKAPKPCDLTSSLGHRS